MEQETQTEVAIINPELKEVIQQSKVEMTVAQHHATAFAPSMQRVNELSKYLATMNKENPSPEESKMARINRLALVKNRTGAEAIKDERKSNLLVESKLIDSLFGVIKNTSALTESQYLQIEQFAEIKEKARKEALRIERLELVKDYAENPELYPLGEMSQDAFDQLLSGLKLAHQAKADAEHQAELKRAEDARIKFLHDQRKNSILNHWQFFPQVWKEENLGDITDEKWESLLKETTENKKVFDDEQEKIRLENESLKKAAEEKEKQLAKEREDAAKAKQLSDSQAKLERDKHDALMDAQRKKSALEKEKADAKLKAARDAQNVAEEKIRKDAEAKQKAEDERLAEEKKAQRAPDKTKLLALADQINELSFPDLKSAEAKKILLETKQRIGETVVFITDKANEL